MKLALLSDLHANLGALDACLADAAARGADQLAFLGDLVGYGAEPGAVLDRVMQRVAAGAWALRGNHDEVAVTPPADTTRADSAGAAWTHAQLSPAQRAFLAGLPLTRREGSTLLVHASAHEPPRWNYVDDARAAAACLDAAAAVDTAAVGGAPITHIFCGHVHVQRLFYQGAGRGLMGFEPTPGVAVPVPAHRRWVATVGSVGQPRDGRTGAMYALFDTTALRLTFVRVPYDHAAAARTIRAAGLPEFNARRLEQGL